MSKAMDNFRHDHDEILMALDILDKMIAAGDQAAREDFLDFVVFLNEFADAYHNGKEEAILFPALIEAGMQQPGGPVGVMLHEHEECRQYIEDMKRALAEPSNYGKFALTARKFSDLQRQHLQKENSILFLVAERMLSPSQLDTIRDALEQYGEEIVGHGRREELFNMLDGLKKKYVA